MKTTMEFNMSDECDAEEYEIYRQAFKYRLCLEEMANWFRARIKYNADNYTEDQQKIIEIAREAFWVIIQDNNADID